MTLNTILQRPIDYEVLPVASGEWFVATGVLDDQNIEDLDILNASGALVLGCRKGFWNGHMGKRDVELFLWGTPNQLMTAQERFKLQPLIDAELDRPEPYWG